MIEGLQTEKIEPQPPTAEKGCGNQYTTTVILRFKNVRDQRVIFPNAVVDELICLLNNKRGSDDETY